jgi:hypothetical protein
MTVQDVLALVTVTLAFGYVVRTLVLPQLGRPASRPDVPVRNLVRRKRGLPAKQ